MQTVELINRALVLAGVVSRNLDQVEGSDGHDGLFWLNALLSELAENGMNIPYITETVITMVPGQETYFVPNLIADETVTFDLDNVRFSMIRQQISAYKGSYRVNNINSLMMKYYVQRVVGGSNILFYFKPNTNYPVTINGKFALANLNYNDDLDLLIDNYYQIYLMYELADKMAAWNFLTLNPKVAVSLDAARRRIRSINTSDMTFRPTGLLSSGQALNWASINLDPAWMTL